MSDMQRPTDGRRTIPPADIDMERWLTVLAASRTSDPPPKPAHDWTKWTPYILAAWVAVSGVAAFTFNNTVDRLQATTEIAAQSRADIARIDRERAARIAATDQKLENLDSRTAPLPTLQGDVSRIEGTVKAQQERYEAGRGERIQNDKDMQTAINSLRTEIALGRQETGQLRQEIGQLRQIMEARNRTTPPFLENPTWKGPTPPSLKARLFAEIANGRVR